MHGGLFNKPLMEVNPRKSYEKNKDGLQGAAGEARCSKVVNLVGVESVVVPRSEH